MDQELEEVDIAVRGYIVQRSIPVSILEVQSGPRSHKESNHIAPIRPGGEMQWGHQLSIEYIQCRESSICEQKF